MNDLIIDDQNYKQFIDQSLNGQKLMRGAIPRDLERSPVGLSALSKPFDLDNQVIPREEWPERIKEKIANK